MKKILSKKQISQIAARVEDDSELAILTRMAEKYRQHVKAVAKAKKRQPKRYLKATDFLTVEQFAKIAELARIFHKFL